jgi:hypothetical protein
VEAARADLGKAKASLEAWEKTAGAGMREESARLRAAIDSLAVDAGRVEQETKEKLEALYEKAGALGRRAVKELQRP